MTPVMPQPREVRCADVHPVRCTVTFRASSSEPLTDRIRDHGARVHGFTPVWYSRERIAVIAEACASAIRR
jgi:predicted small metal-binding protein